jgi:hypothetical protein
MKSLKILLFCFSFLIAGTYWVFAQEEDKDKRPVRSPFESAVLIDNQTVIVPTAKTLELNMVHRFGTIENGKSDLFGLYAPGANIRIGLTYSLLDNLALGVGFTKLNKYVDFNLKYAILQQTRDWSTPISLTYFGNMAIDTREKEVFEVSDNPGLHRLSSFNEIIIATRINKKLSLQVTPSFSYFNKVELGMNNYVVGVGLNGRYKFSPQSSFIFDYNQQVTDHDAVLDVKPNLGFGLEVSTSSHAFQVFVSTFSGILPQHNMVFNVNEFNTDGLLIGFNITRLWNF